MYDILTWVILFWLSKTEILIYLFLLFWKLWMFAISLSDLLHCLWSFGQGLHGSIEECIDGGHISHDGFPQWVEQSIEQSLYVVIDHGLHWGCIYRYTVHLDLTVNTNHKQQCVSWWHTQYEVLCKGYKASISIIINHRLCQHCLLFYSSHFIWL